jgi:hypothetical protein
MRITKDPAGKKLKMEAAPTLVTAKSFPAAGHVMVCPSPSIPKSGDGSGAIYDVWELKPNVDMKGARCMPIPGGPVPTWEGEELYDYLL